MNRKIGLIFVAIVFSYMMGCAQGKPIIHSSAVMDKSQEPQEVSALKKQLRSGFLKKRKEAAKKLGQMGPKAKSAVPELAKALTDKDDDVKIAAGYALAKIGPAAKDAVPGLIKMRNNERVGVRKSAYYALGRIGADARAALPMLEEAYYNDNSNECQGWAVWAYSGINPESEEAMNLLIDALNNESSEIREGASGALTWYSHSQEGMKAAPYLKKILLNKKELRLTRLHAAQALMNIDSENNFDICMDLLIETLKQNEYHYNRDGIIRAAKILGKYDDKTKAAVPHLIEKLCSTSNEDVVNSCSKTLEKIGSGQLQGATMALGHSSECVRLKALDYLKNWGDRALPAYSLAIKDSDVDVRKKTAKILGKLDNNAVPILMKLAFDDSKEVRLQTVVSVANIGIRHPETTNSLIIFVRDQDSDVCIEAINQLLRIKYTGLDFIQELENKAIGNCPDNIKAKANNALKILEAYIRAKEMYK